MGEGTGSNFNTVWYRVMPPATGAVRASTSGSDYDTVIAAFAGSRGSLTLLASNDDAEASGTSEVSFEVQGGGTYYLEVASYGPGGGRLRLYVELISGQTPSPTPTWAVTPTMVGTPFPGSTPTPVATPPGAQLTTQTSLSAAHDASRYFDATRFRVSRDSFWDYLQKRGGLRTFGYPISREFILLGFPVQLFQRGLLQAMPWGGVALMNLLDDGLMPYTRINFSSFPEPEQALITNAPSVADPDYAEKAIAFVKVNVPDRWEGLPVNFLRTFLSTVRLEDAFPEGDGDPAFLPLLNLELWGLPTSRPAYDPNNHSSVYQRFQRGIMHYDATTGATEGILLGDHLKSILTGWRLPPDLEQQASGSRLYRQYDRNKPNHLARPAELPGTNMLYAFEPEEP